MKNDVSEYCVREVQEQSIYGKPNVRRDPEDQKKVFSSPPAYTLTQNCQYTHRYQHVLYTHYRILPKIISDINSDFKYCCYFANTSFTFLDCFYIFHAGKWFQRFHGAEYAATFPETFPARFSSRRPYLEPFDGNSSEGKVKDCKRLAFSQHCIICNWISRKGRFWGRGKMWTPDAWKQICHLGLIVIFVINPTKQKTKWMGGGKVGQLQQKRNTSPLVDWLLPAEEHLSTYMRNCHLG